MYDELHLSKTQTSKRNDKESHFRFWLLLRDILWLSSNVWVIVYYSYFFFWYAHFNICELLLMPGTNSINWMIVNIKTTCYSTQRRRIGLSSAQSNTKHNSRQSLYVSVRSSCEVPVLKLLVSCLTPLLCFDQHVKSITRLAFSHLRNIALIRPMLSAADAEMLIHVFISSRLDYCNSLSSGLSNSATRSLQLVQNYKLQLDYWLEPENVVI